MKTEELIRFMFQNNEIHFLENVKKTQRSKQLKPVFHRFKLLEHGAIETCIHEGVCVDASS